MRRKCLCIKKINSFITIILINIRIFLFDSCCIHLKKDGFYLFNTKFINSSSKIQFSIFSVLMDQYHDDFRNLKNTMLSSKKIATLLEEKDIFLSDHDVTNNIYRIAQSIKKITIFKIIDHISGKGYFINSYVSFSKSSTFCFGNLLQVLFYFIVSYSKKYQKLLLSKHKK